MIKSVIKLFGYYSKWFIAVHKNRKDISSCSFTRNVRVQGNRLHCISELGCAHREHSMCTLCTLCTLCTPCAHRPSDSPRPKLRFWVFLLLILLCLLHTLLGHKGNTKTQLCSWAGTLNIWCSQCAHVVHTVCTTCAHRLSDPLSTKSVFLSVYLVNSLVLAACIART